MVNINLVLSTNCQVSANAKTDFVEYKPYQVGRPGHQVPPGTGPGIVPPDKWGAPGQVGEVPVSFSSLIWSFVFFKQKKHSC